MQLTKKIVTVFFAVSGPVLMAAVTITPQQADTNIAAWLKVLGIDNPPHALVTDYADQFGFWLGLGMLAIALFGISEWAFGKWWQRRITEPLPISNDDHQNGTETPLTTPPPSKYPDEQPLNRFFSPTVTQQYELMPMARAATEIFSEFRRILPERRPSPAWNDSAKILGECAHILLGDDLIPVWGIFPPSTWVEMIPKEDRHFGISGDATEMFDQFNEARRYTNIQIDKRDFERRRMELRQEFGV